MCLLHHCILHLQGNFHDRLFGPHFAPVGVESFGVCAVSFLEFIQLIVLFFSNINVGLRFLPRRELPRLKFEISGLQLIFEVARRAQVILGFCANVLQKLRMLFMWKDPTVTLHFVFFISFFFTVSLFSINTYIIVVGESWHIHSILLQLFGSRTT